ncbi:hypothetical protein [Robiginitalea sp. IMCC43444]|uniref:hypothetical protein n=1 Tax=Robiginitalea sp. IMCC43444 TaxID=3459121 RepID=UPI00404146E8
MNRISLHSALAALLCLLLLPATGSLYGQESKNRPRISLSYTKLMPETSTLSIQARYRGEDGMQPANGLNFEIFNQTETDSLILLGNAITNQEGKAPFQLGDLASKHADSTGLYTFVVKSTEHPSFRIASKTLSIRDAEIGLHFSKETDRTYLEAQLIDINNGAPLEDQPLILQVQRLFRPLRIGGDFNMTDASGSIRIPIASDIPGVNGQLTLEVVLLDNDTYGTVKAIANAPLGVPITDKSTFDQRTMWSPPSKTPLFLLVVSNVLIIGVWGILLYLIANLFYIYKSKNQ